MGLICALMVNSLGTPSASGFFFCENLCRILTNLVVVHQDMLISNFCVKIIWKSHVGTCCIGQITPLGEGPLGEAVALKGHKADGQVVSEVTLK